MQTKFHHRVRSNLSQTHNFRLHAFVIHSFARALPFPLSSFLLRDLIFRLTCNSSSLAVISVALVSSFAVHALLNLACALFLGMQHLCVDNDNESSQNPLIHGFLPPATERAAERRRSMNLPISAPRTVSPPLCSQTAAAQSDPAQRSAFIPAPSSSVVSSSILGSNWIRGSAHHHASKLRTIDNFSPVTRLAF